MVIQHLFRCSCQLTEGKEICGSVFGFTFALHFPPVCVWPLHAREKKCWSGVGPFRHRRDPVCSLCVLPPHEWRVQSWCRRSQRPRTGPSARRRTAGTDLQLPACGCNAPRPTCRLWSATSTGGSSSSGNPAARPADRERETGFDWTFFFF